MNQLNHLPFNPNTANVNQLNKFPLNPNSYDTSISSQGCQHPCSSLTTLGLGSIMEILVQLDPIQQIQLRNPRIFSGQEFKESNQSYTDWNGHKTSDRPQHCTWF